MKLGTILKSKKVKNIGVTLIEILVVAAVILGILLTVQSKLKTGNGTGIGNEKTEEKDSEENVDTAGDAYEIEINMKKNVMIIYQYNQDKTEKKAIKVVNASVGSQVAAGKYKIKGTYTWLNTGENNWSKYNIGYSDSAWIQSVDYADKYSWTLHKNSYNALGKSQSDDKNIKLSAGDAWWVYRQCSEGTVIRIVKGKTSDQLPMEVEPLTKLRKYCGWDPSDPESGNPYKKIANGTISLYDDIVYVEKGSNIDYFANIIALDSKGRNVTNQLQFTEFDTSTMGDHQVKYSYQTKDGTKFQGTVKYCVIDTTVPIVRISQTRFTYEVASASDKDLNKDSVKRAIEELVRSHASASEGSIKVTALPKEQLVVGDNYVRVVAMDQAGNVGSALAVVEIKVKEKKLNQKYKPQKREEETTKKKKDKNNKQEKETTEKITEQETKTTEETTADAESEAGVE